METNPQQFTQGLQLDLADKFQPAVSWNFALNAINDGRQGERGPLLNEEGNISCGVPAGYQIVGHVNTDTDKTYIFITNETISIIASIDNDCNYKELVKTTCLNFSTKYAIDATWREIDGCEDKLYWVDEFNEDRAINLATHELYNAVDRTATAAAYLADKGVPVPKTLTNQNWITLANIYDTWKCDAFLFNKKVKFPVLTYKQTIDKGGSLEAGYYQLYIRYIDSDFNGTDWYGPTLGVPIVEEDLNQTRECIEGCPPETQTTKAFIYNFSNIDTEFPYYEVAVVHTKNGLASAYLEGRFPTSASTIRVDGTWEQDLTVGDLEIGSIKYTQSKGILQADNRLIRYGLKTRTINHAALQRHAMQIKSKYWLSKIEMANREFQHGPKSPYYYENNRGYIPDEVYAFSIQYLFQDGTWSPAYHIPGRNKDVDSEGNDMGLDATGSNRGINALNKWDSTTVAEASTWAGWAPSYNWEHLTAQGYTDAEIERWMVFNTCKPDSTPDAETPDGSGELAYYETKDYRYSSAKDCNNQYVFGDDRDTPIRYHKMPDSNLVTHVEMDDSLGYERTFTNVIGVKFENCAPPAEYADEIVGYRILRARVTDENKSIISQGYCWNNPLGLDPIDLTADQVIRSYPSKWWSANVGADKRNYVEFWSNETTFTREDVSIAEVVKFERETTKSKGRTSDTKGYVLGSCVTGSDTSTDADYGDDKQAFVNVHFNNLHIQPQNGLTNRMFQTSGYVPHNSFISSGDYPDSIANERQNSKYQIYFDDDHKPNHPSFVGTDASGIGQARAYLVTLKRFVQNQYGDPSSNIYFPIRYIDKTSIAYNGVILVNGGDAFVSELAFRRFTGIMQGTDSALEIDGSVSADETIMYEMPNCSRDTGERFPISLFGSETRCYVNSRINAELRHTTLSTLTYEDGDTTGSVNCGGYPSKENCNRPYFDSRDYYVRSLAKWWKCDNDFSYNTDYSTEQLLSPQYPLPLTFDYCTECQDKFPHRFAWSEASVNQEEQDRFLIYKPANYKDTDQSTGPINKMFVRNDQLYILTSGCVWFQPTRPQQLTTNEANIEIGTGEFASLDARAVIKTSYGYGGSISQWGLAVANDGAYWIDIKGRRILQLSESLQDLTERGINSYIKERLTNHLENTYEDIFGEPFPLADTPHHVNGTGAWVWHDPRYKRIMFSVRSWKVTDRAKDLMEAGGLIFNSNTGKWELLMPDPTVGIPTNPDPSGEGYPEWGSGSSAETSESVAAFGTRLYGTFDAKDVPQYFENISFTLSYSMITQTWTSFHSYLPSYAFNTDTYFFTSENNGLWKHAELNFQNYYGQKRDFVLDYSLTGFVVRRLDSVAILGRVESWDTNTFRWKEVHDTFFSHAMVYNNTQSTGKQQVIVSNDSYAAEQGIINTIPIKIHDKFWKFNKLRNMVIDTTQSMFSTNYSDLASSYFIDKVPNPLATSLSKDVYAQGRIRDANSNVRFWFNPQSDYRLVLDLILTKTRRSIR